MNIDNLDMGISDTKKEELIQLVKRQTTLDEVEIKSHLEENNYDYMQVINNHYNISKKKEGAVKSVNQEIYKQIRQKMNSVMKNYNMKKESEMKIDPLS